MTDVLDPSPAPRPQPAPHWFGLRPPETASVAWGARAISTHNQLDIVWNRAQCDQTCRSDDPRQQALHKELHAELDGYFLPLVRQRLAAADPALRGSSTEVTEIASGRVTFRMCPNGSHGYLYMLGFIDREKLTPEEAAAWQSPE